MKEEIQEVSGEVSIVIYDAPLPPRYLKLSKKFLKTLFIVVPLTLVGSFLILFMWGLGGSFQETKDLELPSVLPISDSQVSTLEEENKSLKQSVAELSEKLSAAPATGTPEDPYLMAIKRPYGMQNLLNQNKVNLDQFELVETNNKVSLKFQIISTNPETKVTGHVLVFMISESGVMAYPAEANTALSQGIKYSQGEPFAVSRLRPTNAEFNQRPVGSNVKFIIYIFSREGDLLLIKETNNFSMKAKS